jgi:hypothetical protein
MAVQRTVGLLATLTVAWLSASALAETLARCLKR